MVDLHGLARADEPESDALRIHAKNHFDMIHVNFMTLITLAVNVPILEEYLTSSKCDEAHSCGPDSESHFSAGEKIS